jgi:acid phosphatase type 7
MAVQWATYDTFCVTDSLVEYGTEELNLNMKAQGSCFPFDLGPEQSKQSNHVAYMGGLEASTKYFYRVGDGIDWSKTYHFTSAPNRITLRKHLPQKFLVYGDLGSSLSLPTNSSTIMPWASAEVMGNHFDMILHVGDFGYDLDSNNGTTGRVFMNEIQNMSAYVPYMVDQGNHEGAYDYAHYTEFFRNQPSNQIFQSVTSDAGKAPNNWFFSWNVGLIHFVTLSSEIYYHHVEMVPAQWEWFQADLELANKNRTQAPWIIVNAHRGLYCSCDGDCNTVATRMRAGIPIPNLGMKYGLEELLYKYGVDMWINGHEHNYERMYDIAPKETYTYLSGYTTQTTTDPPATIYIVTGDAGNRENHEGFKYPQPERTAFRTSAYGYSRMTVYNESHLYWEQVEADLSASPAVEGEVIDSFWLIQNNHGSFGN